MPSRRSLPPALGIIRSRTGQGCELPGLEFVSQPGKEHVLAPTDGAWSATPSTPAERAPLLLRTRSHATTRNGRVADEVVEVIEPTTRVVVAHWCSLVWIRSTRCLGLIEVGPRCADVHRRPPAFQSLPANLLDPFAM